MSGWLGQREGLGCLAASVATAYNIRGNEVIEYCGAGVRTCFFMQAKEQVVMPLTYVVRRKQICINYEYFLSFVV